MDIPAAGILHEYISIDELFSELPTVFTKLYLWHDAQISDLDMGEVVVMIVDTLGSLHSP